MRAPTPISKESEVSSDDLRLAFRKHSRINVSVTDFETNLGRWVDL